jgi:hypothetical protein
MPSIADWATVIRGTGQGFCYNAGRAIGSVFMTAIGDTQKKTRRQKRTRRRRSSWY